MTTQTATLSFTVTDDDTALAVGSGSLPVLGTPRLLAWCEAATCAALEPELDEGQTSVGTRISLEHLAASPVGAVVTVTASVSHVDGRLRRFAVAASHRGPAAGGATDANSEQPVKPIGNAEVTRIVVDTERFLSRLG